MSLLLLISLTVSLLPAPGHVEQRVREAAEAYLASSYPELVDRLEVRVSRVSADVEGPLRVSLASPGVPRAHARAHVLGQTPTGWERKGWAMLYVAHFDSIAVTTRAVRRDDPVEASDVAAAWVETTRFHGEPLTMDRYRALQAASKLIASKPLRAGLPLRINDVRAPWAVQTGAAVRMRYERNGIVLELQTRARETGAVDDEIRLYGQDTGTTYRARITEPGRADWLETL